MGKNHVFNNVFAENTPCFYRLKFDFPIDFPNYVEGHNSLITKISPVK